MRKYTAYNKRGCCSPNKEKEPGTDLKGTLIVEAELVSANIIS